MFLSNLNRLGVTVYVFFAVTVMVAIYRYSMRLSAHYDACADALELSSGVADGRFISSFARPHPAASILARCLTVQWITLSSSFKLSSVVAKENSWVGGLHCHRSWKAAKRPHRLIQVWL
jgi:hypothetical protein